MAKRERYFPEDRAYSALLNIAVQALRHTRKRVNESLDRRSGLKHPTFAAPDGSSKGMLTADQDAEDACTNFLVGALGDEKLRVLGEETLWKFQDLDLSTQHLEGYGEDVRIVPGPEKRLVAIIDMVDGSDLLERNLGNWCSAMIFFRPMDLPADRPRILFSMVHHADGMIYGADENETFLFRSDAKHVHSLGRLACARAGRGRVRSFGRFGALYRGIRQWHPSRAALPYFWVVLPPFLQSPRSYQMLGVHAWFWYQVVPRRTDFRTFAHFCA